MVNLTDKEKEENKLAVLYKLVDSNQFVSQALNKLWLRTHVSIKDHFRHMWE